MRRDSPGPQDKSPLLPSTPTLGATYLGGGPHLPTACGAARLICTRFGALGTAHPGALGSQGPGRQEAAAATSGEPGQREGHGGEAGRRVSCPTTRSWLLPGLASLQCLARPLPPPPSQPRLHLMWKLPARLGRTAEEPWCLTHHVLPVS